MLLLAGSLALPELSFSGSQATPAAFPSLREELFASSDNPMLMNARVDAQIHYFMTEGKPLFQNWLDSSARFLPMMKTMFREQGLPEDLVYVAMIESGLRMHAISRSRAVGPWQFMTRTAREYGLTVDQWTDERRDPVKSTRAAAAYLRDLHDRFGSWPLALASYNAGATKIQQALARAGGDGDADLYASQALRRETRYYVPRLLAAITLAGNPEKYGFTANSGRRFRYDTLTIGNSMALRDIALFAGCRPADLEKLNPELEGGATPRYARDYVLRVPVGAKKRYLAALHLFQRDLTPRKIRPGAAIGPIDPARMRQYALLRKRDLSPMPS